MPPIKMAVGIATAGRPDAVKALIELLTQQSRQADKVVICAAMLSDIGVSIDSLPPRFVVVPAFPGLCIQRNAILASVADFDLITFLDDDFVPDVDYLKEIEREFEKNKVMVAASGHVIADGVKGPGISLDAALFLLKQPYASPEVSSKPQYNGYGCNMTFRMITILAQNLRFDENLPLYGWLEDVDFGRRISQFGEVCYLYRPRGVHLGSKKGRSSGVRLGYSQVANPIYLARKGTLDWDVAIRHVRGNLVSNVLRVLWPEKWVDRAGRLKGNLLAILHMVQGKLAPHRVLDLTSKM